MPALVVARSSPHALLENSQTGLGEDPAPLCAKIVEECFHRLCGVTSAPSDCAIASTKSRSRSPRTRNGGLSASRSIQAADEIETGSSSLAAVLPSFEPDHICWRCASDREYLDVCARLLDAQHGTRLVEGMIGGRPISTFLLAEPLVVDIDVNMEKKSPGLVSTESQTTAMQEVPFTSEAFSFQLRIRMVEVPAAKAGRPYASGWEHVEFAVGRGRWESFLEKYYRSTPPIHCAAATEDSGIKTSWIPNLGVRNADVSFTFEFRLQDGAVRPGCVKFHELALDEVIREEEAEGDVEPVPEGYFRGCLSCG